GSQKEQGIDRIPLAVYDGAGLLDTFEVYHFIAHVREHYRSRIFERFAVVGIVELEVPALVFYRAGILEGCAYAHRFRDAELQQDAPGFFPVIVERNG